MKKDSIYTPPNLALAMVDAVGDSPAAGDLIADFAAGNGDLLYAAERKWPSAQMVATDIDPRVAHMIRKNRNNWRVGVCDFLAPRSRNGSSILRNINGKTKVVILNPPFSCRGGKGIPASASGTRVKCSVGMAFIVNSIDYLRTGGIIVAILPAGSLSSEKDAGAWNLVGSQGTVETVTQNGYHTFAGATVDTVVVRFVKGAGQVGYCGICEDVSKETGDGDDADIRLVRGNIQMHLIENMPGRSPVNLIHSTDIRRGQLLDGSFVTNKLARTIQGPMVLIPRVGMPSVDKVVCYVGERSFALSDCVLALLCSSAGKAEEVSASIRANWSIVQDAYGGSGAKYITNRKCVAILRGLGYKVAISGSCKEVETVLEAL